ncbi:MAG: discoidin domain-containing protein [Victivallaceae bacterium]|nr:discoidin domain-containing protein [Victivallaceae bacterium]
MISLPLLILTATASNDTQAATAKFTKGGTARLEAETAQINHDQAEIVKQKSFSDKRGVALKVKRSSNIKKTDSKPDLIFTLQVPQADRYWIRSHAAVDAATGKLMKKAKGKYDSLRLMLAIDDGRPTKRVVFVPWRPADSCKQTLGKFKFNGKKQQIKIWLPTGVRLDYLQISPYRAPKVPAAVKKYQPKLVPPASRPRIWVNKQSLPAVQANLEKGENRRIWKKIKKLADQSYKFKFNPNREVGSNRGLEQRAVAKAFVYLMKGDKDRGKEAVKLIKDYLSVVEFGNLLDITREVGRAIYSAALVYDWCYELMTPKERNSIRHNLMRLADDMEIGWPPFRQMIVNGHGNEAQVNRDLLSMAIAIYDEDPIPYKYCAYRILEELVPMRRFEHQSPRHNQGTSYGWSRFTWDMHAATIFSRMLGHPVFDKNINTVYNHWLYMRLPNKTLFRDGDGWSDGRMARLGVLPLLCYAYSNNPIIKNDFEQQGQSHYYSLLMLLLNNPNLKAAKDFTSLPLTIDFGPILGSMIARTGWNFGKTSNDVVVEMKGGGYHFGNHQHADAGSFQIYYHGLQAVDLGQYHFYGTPYDYNFNKRSIAHSMMLAVDPDENFYRGVNDGGTRFARSCPRTPKQAIENPKFANGNIISANFGPSSQRPFFSYFSVDLTSAYSKKIKKYVRTFCFLNMDNAENPAVLIVLDNMTTAKAKFKKYWQINTLNLPKTTPDGIIISNSEGGIMGQVDLKMLIPKASERKTEILSGKATYNVFGHQFTPPKQSQPEAHGHRVMFSPKKQRKDNTFLTVMSMTAENAPSLPVDLTEQQTVFVLTIADRVVILSKNGKLLRKTFKIKVASGKKHQVLFTGLASGDWSIHSQDWKTQFNIKIKLGKNSVLMQLPVGDYTISPNIIPRAPEYKAPTDFMPTPAITLLNRLLIDGKALNLPSAKKTTTYQLLPAVELFKAMKLPTVEKSNTLQLKVNNRTATFTASATDFKLNGHSFMLPAPVIHENGQWFVPDSVIAALLGRDLIREDNGVNLIKSRIPHQNKLLWIEASENSDTHKLYTMLAAIPGRKKYWSAKGNDIQLRLILTEPTLIKGVAITWHQGAKRQAKFILETSSDGRKWKKVFDGKSSGTTDKMEIYSFNPHKLQQLRFRGYGNSNNNWNSIIHFRLITE